MRDYPEKSEPHSESISYLPNFCDAEVLLRLMLVLELIAIVFTLVSYGGGRFLLHIALISLVVIWLGSTTAVMLCWLRRLNWLGGHLQTTLIAFGITLFMTFATTWLSLSIEDVVRLGPEAANWNYVMARNMTIALILIGLTLRYFYLYHESEQHLKIQTQARLQALQARIRPHFLFNSMNTIASLTHDQPDLAEEAIENLSDLFRASLAAEPSISLQHELELTRSYIDLEALRLGDRLEVNWRVPLEEPVMNLPALTLQPLVENAIYHGIEPLPGGGAIDIEIVPHDHQIEISISNPVMTDQRERHRNGNRMALDNIRERLTLGFGGAATMQLIESDTSYTVKLTIPVEEPE